MQQRQSLGSPLPSPPAAEAADGPKPRRRSRAAAAASDGSLRSPERSIHLIPLLTFLCFLILYLLSHEPSPGDLIGFRGDGMKLENVVTGTNHRGLKVVERPRHRKVRGGR